MTTFENPYLEDFEVVEGDVGGYYVIDTSVHDTEKYPVKQKIIGRPFNSEIAAQIEADRLAQKRWEEAGEPLDVREDR